MVGILSGSPLAIKKPRHILELDGIRGIAALAVFFHHLSYASIDRTPSLWDPLIGHVCTFSSYGLYGVDLFFVLSGYLITTILLKDRGSANFFPNFYWKRALRILPLYVLSLLVALLWFQSSIGGFFVGLLFLANFAGLFHVALTGPYWTLAIEEQFYLVWPQFVYRFQISRLKKTALAVVIVELVLRLADSAFHHYDFRFTFFRCDGLALGAFLACQLYQRDSNLTVDFTPPRKMTPVWILIVGCIFLGFASHLTNSSKYVMQGSALFLSAINLIFYCVIRIAVENSGRRLLAIFRSAALVFLGEISYCMYMSHTYVMRVYDSWRGPLVTGRAVDYWVRIVAVFSATIVVCVISRYALELPVMSLRKYVLRESRQPVFAANGIDK